MQGKKNRYVNHDVIHKENANEKRVVYETVEGLFTSFG